MSLRSIDFELGFADSKLLSYKKTDSTLTVLIEAWNNRTIELVFEDVIRILDNDLNEVMDLCVLDEQDDFFIAALDRVYDQHPEHHAYKHYQLLDLEGEAALEVISANLSVRAR